MATPPDVRDLRPPVEDGPWPPITHLPPMTYGPLRGARSWTGLSYALVRGHRPLVMDVHVPEEARLPAAVHDLVAAVRYLRRYADELGVDAGRLGLWGDSAGAHLVGVSGLAGSSPEPDPWLLGDLGVAADGAHGPARAERTDVQAVVWWYGVADLTALPAPAASWSSRPARSTSSTASRSSPTGTGRSPSCAASSRREERAPQRLRCFFSSLTTALPTPVADVGFCPVTSRPSVTTCGFIGTRDFS